MKNKYHKFGLRELIAIGVGGMIGGGIFSVLGLAVDISGHAAPIAFLIAGIIALVSGYSYVKLALAFHSDGASFTYLEKAFPNKPNMAGVLGWIVVIGYIGTLALYAYTFGVYAADLLGFPASLALRMILSGIVLIAFTIINLMGVRETGISEDIMVYIKIALLLVLAVIGFFTIQSSHYVPLFNKGSLSVFSVGAMIFVAYEGYQLINNTVCETDNIKKNIPRGIYLSVIIVTILYVLLAFISVGNLTGDEFRQHSEYALAIAISPLLGKFGRVLVDIAAILATSSAINATLFGASRMSAEIATRKMMPNAFSFRNKTDVPWIAVIAVAVLSLIFTYAAKLEIIVTFSSLTFLIVSIGVAIANIKLHKKTHSSISLSLLGLILMLLTVIMLTRHLFKENPYIILSILLVYLLIIMLELCFSKRRIFRPKL